MYINVTEIGIIESLFHRVYASVVSGNVVVMVMVNVATEFLSLCLVFYKVFKLCFSCTNFFFCDTLDYQ